jgi:predicted KAP-like P-loop ATPase
VNCDLHLRALEYINNHCYDKLNNASEVSERLQTIQNVMNLVKHLFEGSIPLESQKNIAKTVSSQKGVIDKFDSLLEGHKKNEDLSIMIVNIIICFNSIQNTLTKERVMKWIKDFSHRLCDHIIEPKHNQK